MLQYIRYNYHSIIIIIMLMIAIYIIYYHIEQNKIQKRLAIDNHNKNLQLIQKRKNIKDNYFKQIKNKKNSIIIQNNTPILNENNRKTLMDQYLNLKDLYYNGIPDKYDNTGFKIKGIPPNPEMSIYYLNQAIKLGHLQGWIELGQMYHYGFYDFPSKLDKAMTIYTHIINKIPNKQLINEAHNLYNQALNENEKLRTHKWLNLPYTTTIQPKKTKYELAAKIKPSIKINSAIIQPIEQTIDINNLFRANGQNNMVPVNIDVPVSPEEKGIRNDMHNVHDHSVIATIKSSLDKLQKNTIMKIPTTQCLRDIRNFLSNMPNNDKKKDAIKALDAAERSHMPLSFTDLKEIDAIALVWNRIHSDKHIDNNKVLKENLADELAECIEHDRPVCATGRFTRILDTLNAVDEDINIKPTYAINAEMMNIANNIRDSKYKLLNDDEKKMVDDDLTNTFQKHWLSNLKNEIKNNLKDTYVKTDIMTEATFDKEINQWINEI